MARSTVPSHCRNERGIALITTLLALAIAVTAATAVAYRVHLEIRRTQNVLSADQAQLYARTAEPIAKALLGIDRKANQIDVVNEDEAWTHTNQTLTMEDGATARMVIGDLQGRFNLNSLASTDADRSHFAAELFRRLQEAEAPGAPPELGVKLADWTDPDQNVRFPGGAEDDVYTRMNPPYRPADQLMVDPSELRLLDGMSGDTGRRTWHGLCPYIAALPSADLPTNVNTAPVPVLLSLAPGLSPADAKKAIAGRPYNNVEDFLTRNTAFAAPGLKSGWLSVASEYFLVHTRVTMDRARVDLYSVLHRPSSGPISVIYRARTAPGCVDGRLAFN